MKKNVRVRFAPSPTGHLHIGGLRTALFNYLFARHHGGKYLLRIEDTDTERSKQEYTDAILSSLQWADLEHDESVVIQSERIEDHTVVLQRLLQEKKAYRCYCTEEEVIARCEKKSGENFFSKYDGFCRDRVETPEDATFAIRFACPKDMQEVTWNDLVRGSISIEMDQLDDFIIARKDGQPLYNFVVVIDDAFMGITHIIRGEDHISNTPKQILLYKACGFDLPEFAHIPLILGPSGDRLSKRDGATSVLEYRKMGYLPHAFLNYLVRLGWAYGDQELFTKDELINYFSLENVGKKGSIFNREKLDWINSQYLERTSASDICKYITDENMFAIEDSTFFSRAVDLYKSRVKTVKKLIEVIRNLSEGPCGNYNQDDIQKFFLPNTQEMFDDIISLLKNIDQFDAETIGQAIKNYAKEKNIKFVHIGQPLRVALIGSSDGPGVFDIIALLAKEKTIARIDDCKGYLRSS